MKEKKSMTALMSAFVRAYHYKNCKERIFTDEIAEKLFYDGEYDEMKKSLADGIDFFAPEKKAELKSKKQTIDYIVNTFLAPTVLSRAKFCEDALATAVKTGTRQYVILGAGLDSFCFRNKAVAEKLDVFEVDTAQVQKDKKARLKNAGIEISENLHFVPMDFTKDDLCQCLIKHGFDAKKKTFFSWLGVSYYLSADSVVSLLESISQFACDGSSLAFDFADGKYFSSHARRVKVVMSMAQASGEPMKFCIDYDELTGLLQEQGFLIYDFLTPRDIERDYFAGQDMHAFENTAFALAVLKRTTSGGTKEKILRESLSLFAQNGYEAVSVRDIAAKIGITQSALYKHYSSKRDIFNSIVERMNEQDEKRSKEYMLPTGRLSEMTDEYKKTDIGQIKKFTYAQFCYWTENKFASDFRKMLTIEQYRSKEATDMYAKYLCGGIIEYVKDIFSYSRSINGGMKSAEELAIEFYAPLFMMMSLCDSGADKEKIKKYAKAHIKNFFEGVKQNEVHKK